MGEFDAEIEDDADEADELQHDDEQHGEVQRMEKMRVTGPASLFDEFLVPDGDLPCGVPKLMKPSLSQ